MIDPYVAANVPLVRQLATLLDWALVGHVFLSGALFLLVWRALRLTARIRELEQTVEKLRQGAGASSRDDVQPAVMPPPLLPLADDKPIPTTPCCRKKGTSS
ncbi:MAG: hypothetical protein ACPL7D_05735 [Candidatus Sumerlaeaceae bacterium]|jgi:membrane protein implicated in regulation of membrane protease activity